MKKRLFIYWICWTWRTTSMSRSWWPHKIRSEVVWQRRRLKGWHWRSFLHSNVYVYSDYLMYCSKEVGNRPKVDVPFIDIFHRRPMSGSGVRPPHVKAAAGRRSLVVVGKFYGKILSYYLFAVGTSTHVSQISCIAN